MEEVLLEMINIKKRFYGVEALGGVDFKVNKGEVHVLLGENGAGKSTLMKVLSGAYNYDDGKIIWEGNQVNIKEPYNSLRLGIGMVYQELSLIKALSVFENIWLGRLPKKKYLPFLDWKSAIKKAEETFSKLEIFIDVRRPVSEYDLGIQQLVEIVRAISRDVKLVILDEPTSALTESEVKKLFKTIKSLKEQGVSFIYITHRLKEVFEIGDRVTVLRDGFSVGTIEDIQSAKEGDLVTMMVGRNIAEQYPKICNATKEEIFKVKELSDGKNFFSISFSVHKGEVLGIAGLVGAGRTELAKAIFGLGRIITGEMYANGDLLTYKEPKDAIRKKIGLITKDRKDSLLLHMPIFTNITLAALKGFSIMGFRRKTKELATAVKFIDMLKIDTADTRKKVMHLSGGNQQKIAVAKWCCSKCEIFIMDDPTRGVDVGAKVEVYKLINQLTADGAGVILISSDMPELLGISDNILVMKKGRIVASFDAKKCTQENIVQKAAGGD